MASYLLKAAKLPEGAVVVSEEWFFNNATQNTECHFSYYMPEELRVAVVALEKKYGGSS